MNKGFFRMSVAEWQPENSCANRVRESVFSGILFNTFNFRGFAEHCIDVGTA